MSATDDVDGRADHAAIARAARQDQTGAPLTDDATEEQVVTLAEERATITRRVVETGLVRVRTLTEAIEHVEQATLGLERVEVEHRPVNTWVDAMPEVREEGEITIVPLVEERLIVEKRLFVIEEVHIRRVRSTEPVEVPVTLQRQLAVVERLAPAAGAVRSRTISTVTSEESPMTMTTSDYGASRGLSAMFDSRAEADRAVEALRAAGIADAVLTGDENTGYSGERVENRTEERGFFESLGDFFFPDEGRYVYAEGLNRGSFLVTVSNIPAHQYETALDILDDEGAVDLDARESEWRREGWSYDTRGEADMLPGGAAFTERDEGPAGHRGQPRPGRRQRRAGHAP